MYSPKIYKYKLDQAKIPGEQALILPAGYEILTYDFDGFGHLCLWAIVNDKAENYQHNIAIYFTGQEINPRYNKYQKTLQRNGIVIHIFELL